MPTTTTTPTVRIGAIVGSNDDLRFSGYVVPDPCEAYEAPAGMFLINTGTNAMPWFTFGLLTGRTRRQYGLDCPTIVRFAVETIAEEGVILGVPGDRLLGTWFTRPENISS